ncbi:FAD-dependent oxidoreductase [Spiroplasma alleghenense]|uniref:NADH oxidase n=1 Tax=Spiroplasma alleghenense TaxID=216931 RepID=A0A345Z2M7_9MOLU|nr:FAD-dependent oxidoreductase [Spiroplasma alleghenense]AXK50856.1 NADH oxidase [Spiroplasma alleghenense]
MKVVVIGGAAMGMGVVAKLKRLDPKAEIVVIQKNNYVSLGACGIPYYIGDNFADANIMLARKVEDFEKIGVKVLTNSIVTEVDFKNKKVIAKSNENNIIENYDKLVIATGGTPIINEVLSKQYSNCFTVNSKEDGEDIKKIKSKAKNIVIIGAGLIGLEVAENLANNKVNISVIEKGSRPLANLFDPEFTDLIETELEKNKVNLIKNTEIKEIFSTNDKITEVELIDGTKIKCDLLICSIGVRPNTDFLINTNLKLNERNAIIVDKTGATNIKDVYAGGDCVQTFGRTYKNPVYSPLATVASKHAVIVAENLVGIKSEFAGALNTAIVKIFDLELARTGENSRFLTESKIKYEEVLIKDKDHTNYVSGQRDLWVKLIKDVKKNTLIGCQFGGYDKAIMRIHSIIAMIWNQDVLDPSVNQIDLPYAPPFSRTKDIINIALSKIIEK